MNAKHLYIGAPVQVDTPTGWVKSSIYSLYQSSCRIDNLSEYRYEDIHPIPLTEKYFSSVEEVLGENEIYYEYSSFGKNWRLMDCRSKHIVISTVKYEHELEQLFRLLTGYDLKSENN